MIVALNRGRGEDRINPSILSAFAASVFAHMIVVARFRTHGGGD